METRGQVIGSEEVLIAAKKLLDIDGIEIVKDLDEVTYVHFLFERHQIVYANGAEAESLYCGPEALKSIPAAVKAELFSIFPELTLAANKIATVRPVPSGKRVQNMVRRITKNHSAVFSSSLH